MAATATSSAAAKMMIMSKIEVAHQLIYHENHARARIAENLQSRKLDRESLLRQLMYLVPMEFCWCRRTRTKMRIQSDQWNLHQLSFPTEEQQLLKQPESIKTLIYKTRHGTKSMVEEKRIFKAIKHAPDLPPSDKQTRNNHTIKPTFDEIQALRKQKRAYNANVEQIKGLLEASNREILSLQNQLDDINRKKQEIYEYILQLRNLA
nr:proton pump-interactor 1-like isoform X2 [Ipomoea batatas]GME10267.1 proton pump-interactor 1-like isoform X2 [Ipomoea batatas]